MSKNHSAILDLGPPGTDVDLGPLDGGSSAASQLQFQDFPRMTSESSLPTSPKFSINLGDESTTGGDDGDQDDHQTLLGNKSRGGHQGTPGGPQASFWELNFFAKYFDVTTHDVMSRMLWSVVPFPVSNGSRGGGNTYVEKYIKNNADLYGPLWINVTLIFSIAICGNISSYLSTADGSLWHYDFTKVGLAASTVSTYTVAVPVALWFFFWFRGCTSMYTLLETICAYGYSLSVYIPISILWTIGVSTLQYILVITGALLSGSVLLFSFAPVVNSDPSQTVKFSYIVLLIILALHSLLAFCFLLYFF